MIFKNVEKTILALVILLYIAVIGPVLFSSTSSALVALGVVSLLALLLWIDKVFTNFIVGKED